MTDRRNFVAVTSFGKTSHVRKFTRLENGTWNTYRWEGGWVWHDNVGDATAADWREAADEVFFEEPQP